MNLIFFEEMTEKTDKANAVDVVFVDINKIFKVLHDRLIQKV